MEHEMSEHKTAVVDPVTRLFCEDGMKPGRIVVPVPDNPDPRRNYYSGDPDTPIASWTDAQVAARDEARRFAAERQIRDDWTPDADNVVIEALLADLPSLIAELTATGTVRVPWWVARLTQQARSIHRARRK